MMDDFSVPLGQHGTRKRATFLRPTPAQSAGVLVVAVGVLAAAWIMKADPARQESASSAAPALAPPSVAAKESAPLGGAANPQSAPIDTAADMPAATPSPGRTVTIIDGTTGRRREIVIPEPKDPAGLDAQAQALPVGKMTLSAPGSRVPPRPVPAR